MDFQLQEVEVVVVLEVWMKVSMHSLLFKLGLLGHEIALTSPGQEDKLSGGSVLLFGHQACDSDTGLFSLIHRLMKA